LLYFGLGCRNVSKLFIPKCFEIERLITQFEGFQSLKLHQKYASNYLYQRNIFAIHQKHFIDSGILLLFESVEPHSPLSVLHYEWYDVEDEVKKRIEAYSSEIQCVVSKSEVFGNIKPGQSQFPELGDYADGLDTLNFILNIS
jgi:hypothetical protein